MKPEWERKHEAEMADVLRKLQETQKAAIDARLAASMEPVTVDFGFGWKATVPRGLAELWRIQDLGAAEAERRRGRSKKKDKDERPESAKEFDLRQRAYAREYRMWVARATGTKEEGGR